MFAPERLSLNMHSSLGEEASVLSVERGKTVLVLLESFLHVQCLPVQKFLLICSMLYGRYSLWYIVCWLYRFGWQLDPLKTKFLFDVQKFWILRACVVIFFLLVPMCFPYFSLIKTNRKKKNNKKILTKYEPDPLQGYNLCKCCWIYHILNVWPSKRNLR